VNIPECIDGVVVFDCRAEKKIEEAAAPRKKRSRKNYLSKP
jgi:hypothetical protein